MMMHMTNVADRLQSQRIAAKPSMAYCFEIFLTAGALGANLASTPSSIRGCETLIKRT
jgi:hypothetical protein